MALAWKPIYGGNGSAAQGAEGGRLEVTPTNGIGEPVWWRVAVYFAWRDCQVVINPTSGSLMAGNEEDAREKAEEIAREFKALMDAKGAP